MNLMIQYTVVGLVVALAVRSVWRRFRPSRFSSCGSDGCGFCSTGCQPRSLGDGQAASSCQAVKLIPARDESSGQKSSV